MLLSGPRHGGHAGIENYIQVRREVVMERRKGLSRGSVLVMACLMMVVMCLSMVPRAHADGCQTCAKTAYDFRVACESQCTAGTMSMGGRTFTVHPDSCKLGCLRYYNELYNCNGKIVKWN